jgi:quercetin dioxygenase-like cupin family protein
MSPARVSSLVLAAAALALALGASAQAPGIKRTLTQKFDIPAGDREAVQAVAEIAKGASAGRHTHPGPEFGYVLDGTSVLEVDGEAPRTLKAGDYYLIPAGKIHDAKGTGENGVKVLATYLVEKGKPLSTPAP